MSPAIRAFPHRLLRRIGRAEIDLLSRSGHAQWLGPVRQVADELARRQGLGAARIDLVRLATVNLEDLRHEFPGRWRFAILADSPADRIGFLALDPLLCGRLQALLGGTAEASRGMFAAEPGENGAVGWLMASALELLSEQHQERAFGGYRYCGLCESAGSVGRICIQQERLIGSWLRVRVGWDEGFAVWLEPESSANRRALSEHSVIDIDSNPLLSEIEVEFRCRLGRAELSAAEIAHLGHDDVIVFDPVDPPGCRELSAGVCRITGKIEGNRFEIVGFEHTNGGEVMDSVDITTCPGASEFDASRLGGLPVEISIEAGRVGLSVSRLAKLRAGDVLTMPTAVLGPVDLRASGRLVARGELVDVEGKRGVRVCELALSHGVSDEEPV